MSRTAIVLAAVLCCLTVARAGDPYSADRQNMKIILKVVASSLEKNFYDPKMHGLDWKATVDEARKKIETAATVNDMIAAIQELPEKLDDSHTAFLPPFSAIRAVYGFEVKMIGADAFVYDIDEKGAAAKAGLKIGDRIVDIDDIPLHRSNLDKVMLQKRVVYPVDPMYLNVRRAKESVTIEIHPQVKKSPALLDRFSRYNDFWNMYLEEQTYAEKYLRFESGTSGRVGYLNIRLFPAEGSQFLSGLAQSLKGSSAYVIDLRDTPGGSVDTLLNFLGMFEENEVQLGSAVGRIKTEPLKIKPRRPHMEGPIVVLVDSNTASAAEVTARYLQKNHHAIVIGDDTAGMATMARVFPGETGSPNVIDFATNIAVARLLLPDGEELEKKGVKPDVVCLPTGADLAGAKDPCLARALATAEGALTASAK